MREPARSIQANKARRRARERARGAGASVAIIDADPNRPVSRWAIRPGKPASLTVAGDVNEDAILDRIDLAARQAAFVIVDLEGTASLMVG